MNTIRVNCGTIYVDVPVAELKPCPGAKGFRYHPTAQRGRLGWPIVVDADDRVLDPDEDGRFAIGKTKKTFEDLLKPPKKRRKKKPST